MELNTNCIVCEKEIVPGGRICEECSWEFKTIKALLESGEQGLQIEAIERFNRVGKE